MSQTFTDDCYAGTHTGTTDLQAFEDNFAALKSAFSGPTTPSNTVAGMWWFDTTANILKLRDEANAAWLSVWDFANNKPVVTNNVSADFGAAMKDAAAATASLRTLGTGALQACAGNDARLNVVDGTITGNKFPALTASATLWGVYAGAAETTSSTSFVKMYGYQIKRNGSVRLRYNILDVTGGLTTTRIYVNGVYISGTEDSTNNSSTGLDCSHDLTVSFDDQIDIYMHSTSGYTAQVGPLSGNTSVYLYATDPLCGVLS